VNADRAGAVQRGPVTLNSFIPPLNEKDHVRGPADAPVTLIEYGDYECPDCLASEPIVRAVLEQAGPKVRAVFRHFPRNSIHPRAGVAAAAAEAAGLQNRFWDMHTALYKHQANLIDLDLTHLALSIGLDVYRFTRDIDTPAVLARVAADFDAATAAGLNGTPAFFVNGIRHRGSLTLDALLQVIGAAPSIF
jgi:protein-disulfide isomerase